MARSVALLVGTRKGLFVLRSGARRARWKAEGPHFAGEPVYHASFDPRDGASLYAGTNGTWGGPRIEVSRDLGKTWKTATNPAFPAGSDQTFTRTWHLEPGHASTPKVVWAGVEPGALFRSDDGGMTWSLVSGLTDHPTRSMWNPGGSGGISLHSIAVDASDPKRLGIGISSGGYYETRDGGTTWTPRNQGIPAPYMPDPTVEAGHCVHHVVAHPKAGGVVFMQAHHGVKWWDEKRARWEGSAKGLPSDYGFASAIHPHDESTAYVFPLDWPQRMTDKLGAAVYRTRDRGKSWTRHSTGLPKGAAMEVMRDGMATDRLDPAGVYFGTNAGEVWGSANEGRTWARLAAYLPPVLSIETATL